MSKTSLIRLVFFSALHFVSALQQKKERGRGERERETQLVQCFGRVLSAFCGAAPGRSSGSAAAAITSN